MLNSACCHVQNKSVSFIQTQFVFVCQQHTCLVLLLYFHYYFLLHFNVTLFSVSAGTQKIIRAIIFDQDVLEKGT